jgi:hypothetical protein
MTKRWLGKEKTHDDNSYVAKAAVSQFGHCVYASIQNTRFSIAYTIREPN